LVNRAFVRSGEPPRHDRPRECAVASASSVARVSAPRRAWCRARWRRCRGCSPDAGFPPVLRPTCRGRGPGDAGTSIRRARRPCNLTALPACSSPRVEHRLRMVTSQETSPERHRGSGSARGERSPRCCRRPVVLQPCSGTMGDAPTVWFMVRSTTPPWASGTTRDRSAERRWRSRPIFLEALRRPDSSPHGTSVPASPRGGTLRESTQLVTLEGEAALRAPAATHQRRH
jgi:hypothetical protein